MTDRLLGIILCGGRSTRMGRDKSALPHPAGGTFLSHAMDRLSGLCGQVFVSAAAPIESTDVETIVDRTPHRGPAGGIAASLRFAEDHGYAACLVTPIDMPDLTRDDLRRLVEMWMAKESLCCAESELDGRIQPLAAIYPTSLQAEMQMLADSDRRSVSRWIEAQRPDRVRLSATSCRNVNAPQDLVDRTDGPI